MTSWFYIRPTDTIFVRGNQAFGDGGEHGVGQMPPPPSVFAGALRSAMLGLDGEVLAQFVRQARVSDARLAASLGTPTQPGAFRLSWLSLCGMTSAKVDALLPLPADLLWLGKTEGLATLQARGLPAGVESSGPLPMRAVLATSKLVKPEGGGYLRLAGLRSHLEGRLPELDDLVPSRSVHKLDPRLGIELNSESRTAEKSRIYTTEGHAFTPAAERDERGKSIPARYDSTGFLVGIAGADGLLPAQGHLRLGGDGRSAEYVQVDFKPPQVDGAAISKHGRFRLILQTPGLFGDWLPPGCELGAGDSYRLTANGFSARLACAAIGRREIVSGWDLHQWAPKPAEAAAPAGSVYWFDEFSGDAGKLAAWAAGGLRGDTAALPSTRHAEGFNQALLGLWPQS
ncbi:type III-B CRISPR module-associated Cmr3 family protein [Roseateles sp. GG27B]